eukprot:CAMPEP_0197831098 /NCGR_PEP_ID=MMETSP1437-20131217/7695_1 /TAXON_ID=49252 ORGANISM="Eucampia antarctica, Strain CCMP1452" /NCGR_SAMPLE_ID=MMETSP1437 /ASSEMBLY_ACC=CAM_ASM_001096 /LENGTH=555 /DNA_ID=CAMNT_0043433869 /DNA_START=303 /DNA_END=1970 /DNA_ORIENTATION=+
MKAPLKQQLLVLVIIVVQIVASAASTIITAASLPTSLPRTINRVKNVSSSTTFADDDAESCFEEGEYEYDTYDDYEEIEQDRGDVEKKNGIAEDDEASYRKNEEWWKDPLAQFEDEEGKVEEEIYEEEEEEEEVVVYKEKEAPVSMLKSETIQQSEEKEEQKAKLSETAINDDINKIRQQEDKESQTLNENQSEDSKKSSKPFSVGSSLSTLTRQRFRGSKQSVSPPSMLSAPALPTLVMQKLLRNISPHATAAQLFISLALGNIALHFFQKINKRIDDEPNIKRNDVQNDTEGNEDNSKEDEEEYLDEEEVERLQELGFGRNRNHTNGSYPNTMDEDAETTLSEGESEGGYEGEYENLDNGSSDENIAANKENGQEFNWGKNSVLKFGQARKKREEQLSKAKELKAIADDKSKDRLKRQKKKRLSISELQNELESMAEKVDKVENERELLEREYDTSNRKLVSVQNKLKSLTQSYEYQQKQRREDSATVENAVRVERERASEELKRVRSAMVSVLEQERRLIRVQIKQTSAQVRSMMDEYRDESYDCSSDFDGN